MKQEVWPFNPHGSGESCEDLWGLVNQRGQGWRAPATDVKLYQMNVRRQIVG